MFISSKAGRSAEPSSSYSSSPTEHFRDDDNGDDQDRTDSLLDALLAADRTHYEHEHMQLTLYVSLAPPSADLEDEDVHEGFEAVLEGIFEHDENEERQVSLVEDVFPCYSWEQHMLNLKHDVPETVSAGVKGLSEVAAEERAQG